ncbi:MAG TPA: hypothetical protein VET48_04830 [Steroidobacteraceae bacterium]|nr:hypothetical protein [Steroidobacteraceae bacterium]
MDQNPAPPTNQVQSPTLLSSLVPNSQTTVNGLAGALAYVWVVHQHMKGIDYPAGYEVSIGVIFMAVVSYAHDFAALLFGKLRRWLST